MSKAINAQGSWINGYPLARKPAHKAMDKWLSKNPKKSLEYSMDKWLSKGKNKAQDRHG